MGIGGEVVARLTAVIGVDNSGLKHGLRESEAETKRSGSRIGGALKDAGKIAAGGLAAVGVVAVGALADGVKGAIQLQAKMAVLDKALRNAGASAKQVAGTQSYLEDQSNKTGFAIGDLADSFGRSVTALGSYKKAQAETALAENIARSTGESLTMANKQAVKVYEGKNTALAKLGVNLPKITSAEDHLSATNKHATAAEKLHAKQIDAKRTAMADAKAATDKYKGSTEAYGKTLQGQMQITETRFHNILDAVGGKLLPVISSLLGWILKVAGSQDMQKWLGDVTQAFQVAKGYIVKAWDYVRRVWNANSKDIIGTGKQIVKFLAAAFKWLEPILKTYLGVIVKIIKDALKVIGDIIHLAMDLIQGHWGKAWGALKSLVSDALNLVWDDLKGFVTIFGTVAGKIGSAIKDGIVSALGSLGHAVLGLINGAVNMGIVDPLNRLINEAVHLESLVPGSPNLHIPHDPIPRLALARGGIVPGAGNRDSVLAMLTPGEMVLNRQQQGRLASMLGVGGTGARGGGGVTVNQTIITATDDQGVHMRAARFAAQAAFG